MLYLKELVEKSNAVASDQVALSARIIPLLDATALNEDCTDATVQRLCQLATGEPRVAAVCVLPQFVRHAKQFLQGSQVKVASIANFPGGDAALELVLADISSLLAASVDEIDVVFPYRRYLSSESEREYCRHWLQAVRAATQGRAILKVIIETGAFEDETKLHLLARDLIRLGVDFLKTSTGKIIAGADLRRTGILLYALLEMQAEGFDRAGIKISGGIKTQQQVAQYLFLIKEIMGESWRVTADHVRFGASQLLENLRS